MRIDLNDPAEKCFYNIPEVVASYAEEMGYELHFDEETGLYRAYRSEDGEMTAEITPDELMTAKIQDLF